MVTSGSHGESVDLFPAWPQVSVDSFIRRCWLLLVTSGSTRTETLDSGVTEESVTFLSTLVSLRVLRTTFLSVEIRSGWNFHSHHITSVYLMTTGNKTFLYELLAYRLSLFVKIHREIELFS